MGLSRVPDLDSLVLLLTVDSEGSLGRAAGAHGLSQPAVSARIRVMEGLVGFGLVERGARGSTLTPAGRLVAGWARGVLDAAAVLDTGIASLRDDTAHRLRVAASMTVAEHLLPGWLVRLSSTQTDVAVSLAAMNSQAVQEAVLEGRADLGFVEGPQVSSALDRQVVASDHLVLVVPPAHPWARRRSVEASELAGTRLVQREPASGTREAMEEALAAYEPMAIPLLELSTTNAVRSAVTAGAGPAVLSGLAVVDDVSAGRLVEVEVTGVTLVRCLRAVWPRGQRPSGPARTLLDIARRHQARSS